MKYCFYYLPKKGEDWKVLYFEAKEKKEFLKIFMKIYRMKFSNFEIIKKEF